MLSALLVFLAFGAILGLLNRADFIIDSTSRVILSFIGSISTLSVLYFCLLLLPGQISWTSKIILPIGLAALGVIFYFNRNYASSCMLDITYVTGWSLNDRDKESRTVGTLAERKGKSLYRLIFIASCLIIIFTNIANPSPANWDSNTYNVARISSMIAGASPFIDQTSVARQAYYSISHDILLYPDILFNNTRGLGLVSGLEFIALMCILAQILLNFTSRLRNSSIPNSEISIYPGLIFSLCLLLSSDMQAMQSVITKNDLIITVCFVFGLYMATKYTSNEISLPTFFAGSTLIGIYSLTSKSYGAIAFIPIVISFGISIFRAVLHRWQRQAIEPGFSPSRLISSTEYLIRLAITSPARIFYTGAFVGLSSAQLYINYKIRQFASMHYAGDVAWNSRTWTNTNNELRESLFIFLINTIRNTVSIIAYQLTSIPYLGPRLFSRLSKFIDLDILSSDIGVGGGTEFQWPGYHHDESHTSIFVIVSVLLSFAAWRHLSRRYSFYLLPDMSRLDKSLSVLYVVILSSCILAYCAITYAILYQPWVGRFLGPSYVPLIPVSSFILTQYFHLNSKKMYLSRFLLSTKTLIPLVSILMFISHVSTSSFRSDLSLTFSSRYSGIPLPERRYAGHIAQITKTYPSSYRPLLNHLRDSKFKQRFICTGGDSWTLTPMMSSMANKSYNGFNLVSIPAIACEKIVGIPQSSSRFSSTSEKFLQPSIYTKGDAEYIFLP